MLNSDSKERHQHMIELRRVSKFYSNRDTVSTGFSKLDLTLDMGEFVAITGESGSGKSTLLNVISGLDTYEEGEMFVGGEDTSGFRPVDYERYRKQYIGNIFQDFNLVNSYTVYQNVELSMLLCGIDKETCKKKIPELLELVGMTKYTRTRASRLSGGQKQRVAIARALAKDAPIIVADEPTGNLDSKSAAIVMEALHKISREKLVVIVTHNYDQVEPYVSRKITMHDGRIIEDTRTRELENEQPAGEQGRAGKHSENFEIKGGKQPSGNMTCGTKMMLGVRNTFNLPAKFILLLLVYMFAAAAVLGGYSSTRSSLHETDLLGYNPYFSYTAPDRIVVAREDRTPITQEDINKLKSTTGVKKVIQNDIGLDNSIGLETDQADIRGAVYNLSESGLTEKKLFAGTMPEGDNDVVCQFDTAYAQSSKELKADPSKILGSEFYCYRFNSDDPARPVPQKLRVTGILFVDSSKSKNSQINMETGNSRIYVSDNLASQLNMNKIALASDITVDYNGMKVKTSAGQGIPVIVSDRVPAGKAYISQDQLSYFAKEPGSDIPAESSVIGKPLNLTAKNMFFQKDVSLTVGKIYTEKTIDSVLGYKKDDYPSYSQSVFVNSADYNNLFSNGNYQVSVMVKNELDAGNVAHLLRKDGYKVIPLKDARSDYTGGFSFVIKLMTMGGFIIEMVVMFFILYAVVRLIMKSRNSYYSTLRILGATRGDTAMILRIELVLMMIIASAVDMLGLMLVKHGVIHSSTISGLIAFLTVKDYLLLFAGLLLMSILIAARYSAKLFRKSAMSAYREEE
ncbi:MAG: ABC transporter ATP-binding protein [Baileyella intestinalis]|uniref:ABC transporter ATP-binding protein/permease n=1 Tax=Baileyella intestinalis TaxID=2606709 RepID=UPI002A766810|nr:ABC transporter ATP-binding protein [Baileyella intestinalis]MDY2994233.1 ABC transporter ATP-binding protein [Baileyella intestinalis]